MLTRGSVQNGAQYEECRQRRHQSLHHEVGHELRHVGLKARQPPGCDSSTRQGHGNSKRSEPTQKRLQGQKHDCPEHPLGEPSADGERYRSLAARLTPAITSDSSAAEGASKSRTEIMSLSSCGIAICPIPQSGTHIENKLAGDRQPASLHSCCGLPGW